MATGKIKTLYSDKEKTEVLFPRTKTSAISDADGVGLDALMEHLAYTDTDGGEVSVVPVDADTLGGLPAENYATQSFVTNKIAEAQLSGGGSGEIDLSGYATKDDVSDVSNLVGDTAVSVQIGNAINNIDFPVDSVNGKTGEVQLSASDVGAVSTSGASMENNAYIHFKHSDSGVAWSYSGEKYVLRPITGTGLELLSNNGSGYIPALKLAPDGKIELGNSKINGELKVGDKLSFRTDGEGGNITIFPPANTGIQNWEIDAHDGNVRFYNLADDGTYNEPLKLYKDGSIGSSNTAKTRERLGAAPASLASDMAAADDNIRKFLIANASSWIIPDILLIDTTNPFGDNNRTGWIASGTTSNMPSGVSHAIREIFYVNNQWILAKFTGWDSNLQPCSFHISYSVPLGGWTEWEWENPPMVLGTEYRTTERYKGKPVYATTVNFGALPNATIKGVAHGVSIGQPVRIEGRTSQRISLPYSIVTELYFEPSSVVIKTNTDASHITAEVTIYYTKN